MELRYCASLLWRWLWLLVLVMLLAGAASYITSKRTTPVYSASTTMLISPSRAQVMDALAFQPEIERLAGTYAEMMRGRPVIEEVTRNLALPQESSWSVSVGPIRNTQLLLLTVEATDPQAAAIIANEIPRVFVRQNYELQARRYADSKAGLQRQIDDIQAKIDALQGQVQVVEASASADKSVLEGQRRELQTLQSSYVTLTASYEELRLEEAKQLDTLLVTEEARPPLSPIRPKTRQNTLLAIVLGVMLAAGFVLVIEYLDDRLKDPERVSALGLTILAAVPMMEDIGQAPELVTSAGGQSRVVEAYRILRTNLPFAAVDHPLRTLLVTSPLPNEGKSTTSANLAVALAQSGRRVILVDVDFHRPSQHRLMRLGNNTGLTFGLVREKIDLTRLPQDTEVPGLRVLTTGPLPPNPAEILASARMLTVLAALADQADIVVLDGPPVLAVADTAILASRVDGVLMVVDAQRTRRKLAERALESLQQVQAQVLGAVLNRVPGDTNYPYYNYRNSYDDERTVRHLPQKSFGRRRPPETAGSSHHRMNGE